MSNSDFNQTLEECGWLTKITHNVCCAYKYTFYSPIYIRYINWYMFHNKPWKYFTQLFIDVYKSKHKKLFKLWTQRKGEHNNIKSEYVQNSDIGTYRLFDFN